ncbi:MAG: glycosyl hydrolase [bacterium]|nr:glycosyl hydrolase [bacterium]
MKRTLWILAALALLAAPAAAVAKDKEEKAPADKNPLNAETFAGLGLRLLGPALASGRVGDFAVNPADPAEYYVAVSSGGVWKTVNAGTTYEPVFDGEGSYSIGCVTLDPRDPKVVWVGAGENNSQRSVGYGDGVYKSVDGGRNWTNTGLKESEHVGMIVVDPRDSDTVYVAAQGPLWRSGGDRGLYRTTDGGATWQKILDISPDTGVSELRLDPRDPDVMYAVSYQRRRHVWVLLDGGPESAIHKSVDGGKTWRKLTRGLPAGDLGRIGIAVSPARPDLVFAIVEAAEAGGFYRSDDAGENWRQMSDYVTTSPQYYQEIFADPHAAERVYSLDTYFQVTEDGGATWKRVPIESKHVDDHALWIDPDDVDHLLIGCDGGIYETWDRGANWDYKANLPVTQFYKVAVDQAVPFYYVYGGTQDNNTIGGPSRTNNNHGLRNSDWFVTQGGDGFEPQIDPTDPSIVYSQYQHGGLARFDRRSGESLDIQPQPAWGEPAYRFNWNSPLLISPHDHERLYFGCQKLLRSDDRGASWTEVSGDLSRGLDRNRLEVMGRVWSVDAVAKNRSTSFYGSLVSLDESVLREGLIYAGTDDGLVQVTLDGGRTWQARDGFAGAPAQAFVEDLDADRHREATVYVCLDNHKKGDFKPYLLRSDDHGKTWRSIAGDLPERGTVHCFVQDHVNPDLLFCGTEFGVYFTLDGGGRWVRLKGGFPVISVRDLEIQRRENDLVVGTFGRGIYVLDDYAPLRAITRAALEGEPALLFPVKDALLYNEGSPLGGRGKASQGDSFYRADNPPFGAVFTLHLREKLSGRRDRRHEAEKALVEKKEPVHYPSWDDLRAEDREDAPGYFLEIADLDGRVVRRVAVANQAGLQRVSWDLRDPSLRPAGTSPATDGGPLVAPGQYVAQLMRRADDVVTPLAAPQRFTVKPLALAALASREPTELQRFQRAVAELQRSVLGAVGKADEVQERIDHVKPALFNTTGAGGAELATLRAIEARLADLRVILQGDDTVASRNEPTPPSLVERIERVAYGSWESSAPPTGTHRETYRTVAERFPQVQSELAAIDADLAGFERMLEAMGAPWTPGRSPVWRADK